MLKHLEVPAAGEEWTVALLDKPDVIDDGSGVRCSEARSFKVERV